MTARSSLPDLDALYASELPCVYSFLYRLGVPGKDLEDLAHDVFVTAMRSQARYDPSRPVRPWMLGIAFRVAADFKRTAHRTREVAGEVPEVPDEPSSLERTVEEREARDLVSEALASLPPERRAAVIMYELEGLPVAQIAEAMSVPAPTVYSRLRIGREELTQAIRRIQFQRGDA